MQRWKDALVNLEAVLQVNPDSADVHRALAETYDHLGIPDLAAEHRRSGMSGGGQEPRYGSIGGPHR